MVKSQATSSMGDVLAKVGVRKRKEREKIQEYKKRLLGKNLQSGFSI